MSEELKLWKTRIANPIVKKDKVNLIKNGKVVKTVDPRKNK